MEASSLGSDAHNWGEKGKKNVSDLHGSWQLLSKLNKDEKNGFHQQTNLGWAGVKSLEIRFLSNRNADIAQDLDEWVVPWVTNGIQGIWNPRSRGFFTIKDFFNEASSTNSYQLWAATTSHYSTWLTATSALLIHKTSNVERNHPRFDHLGGRSSYHWIWIPAVGFLSEMEWLTPKKDRVSFLKIAGAQVHASFQ